jgi:pseudouridylate synthase
MPAAPAVAVSDDIRVAVAAGRPVVALETTIITHGLPRPRNVTTALAAEEVLRGAGVVPATIGVVDGRPTVGLTAAEIEGLGAADAVHKIGTRDLPVAMAQGWSGGTTVAATALLAHRAGVGVFATGGLGGVHRGATTTFDESADLVALAGLPLLVVSAGVKSILDVGATLERLETLGVTVLGYRTGAFPGFYVRDSGFPVADRVETPAEVAAVVRARDALGLRSAVLLANPVDETDELDDEVHRAVLDGALADAGTRGVRGKDTTPHLLDHLHRASGGRSLEVNVALYRANVALAGEVAPGPGGADHRVTGPPPQPSPASSSSRPTVRIEAQVSSTWWASRTRSCRAPAWSRTWSRSNASPVNPSPVNMASSGSWSATTSTWTFDRPCPSASRRAWRASSRPRPAPR